MAGKGINKLSFVGMYQRTILSQLKRFLEERNNPLLRNMQRLPETLLRNSLRRDLLRFISKLEKRTLMTFKQLEYSIKSDGEGPKNPKKVESKSPKGDEKILSKEPILKTVPPVQPSLKTSGGDAKMQSQNKNTKLPTIEPTLKTSGKAILPQSKTLEKDPNLQLDQMTLKSLVKTAKAQIQQTLEGDKNENVQQRPSSEQEQSPPLQRLDKTVLAEALEHIKFYESEIAALRSMKPYSEMSILEFCECRPHKADLIPHEGKSLFWPHLPDDQKPGPVGRPEIEEATEEIFVFGGDIGEATSVKQFGHVQEEIHAHISLKNIEAEATRVKNRLAELKKLEAEPKLKPGEIMNPAEIESRKIEIEHLEKTLVALNEATVEAKKEEDIKEKLRPIIEEKIPKKLEEVEARLAALNASPLQTNDADARLNRVIELELLDKKYKELKAEAEREEEKSHVGRFSQTVKSIVTSHLVPEHAELMKKIQELEEELEHIKKEKKLLEYERHRESGRVIPDKKLTPTLSPVIPQNHPNKPETKKFHTQGKEVMVATTSKVDEIMPISNDLGSGLINSSKMKSLEKEANINMIQSVEKANDLFDGKNIPKDDQKRIN